MYSKNDLLFLMLREFFSYGAFVMPAYDLPSSSLSFLVKENPGKIKEMPSRCRGNKG